MYFVSHPSKQQDIVIYVQLGLNTNFEGNVHFVIEILLKIWHAEKWLGVVYLKLQYEG